MKGEQAPGRSAFDLSDVYGHTPVEKMFAGADVYGVGHDPQRAERPPVRLGLIGAGGVAQSKWLPALWRLRTLWDPVELVAIADPAEDQGRKVARQYGCMWYRDHAELLAAGTLDAVLVASPDRLHAEHTRHAVEMGLAVLVEKPFCTSLVDAEELCRASEKQGTLLMPVANLRFSPPLRRARQAAAQMPGLQGPKILLGKMHLGYDYVDLLEDATVHLFDLTRFLLGNAIVVSARSVGRPAGRRPYPFGQAAITVEFESGSVAQLFTSSTALSLKPWLRVELHGRGTWLVVDDVWELVIYDDETGPAQSWRPVMASTLLFDEEFGGYLPQLEHFLQVARGQEHPSVTAVDGYRAAELIAATHLAIRRGRDVPLPLDPEEADQELAALGRTGLGGAAD